MFYFVPDVLYVVRCMFICRVLYVVIEYQRARDMEEEEASMYYLQKTSKNDSLACVTRNVYDCSLVGVRRRRGGGGDNEAVDWSLD